MRHRLVGLALALLALASAVFALDGDSSLRVARVFGDNMVMQQARPIPIWGQAAPGEKIHVTLAGVAAETQAAADGRWRLSLPALPAGGPYVVTVSGATEVTFHNVMIGEVWLVSGQSNMDFRLRQASGAAADVATANFPGIRCVRIPQSVSREPLTDLPSASWRVCSAATAGDFPAVGFYFARELLRHSGVAIGLINATWSGSTAEAWISGPVLARRPDFKEQIEAIAALGENWAAGQQDTDRLTLERERLFETEGSGVAHGVHRPGYDDSAWPAADYPLDVVTMHQPDYSIVWLRKTIEVPSDAAGRDLTLNLGQVYEWDQTYFNGERIGSARWDGVRAYVVPGRLVHAGPNTIAVRLLSEWQAGQLGKPHDRPALHSADGSVHVSLAGPWKYDGRFEPPLRVGRFYHREPTALFNGMIAPIAGYGLRGALWYQGEGNAGHPGQYRTLLPALLTDWRTRWAQGDFPFLVVQLPNIAAPQGRLWPELREAQAMATRLPHVGLAVTIDVGDPDNIHPANKRPVGERLCLVARHLAYGEKLVWTGPTFAGFEPEQGALRVRFELAGSELRTADGGPVRGFEVRAVDGDFEPAQAVIEGDAVVVRAEGVPHPAAVRYAWAPNPQANLRNREGLPAAPFRSAPSVP